jgi:hypothetical protein
MLPAPPPLPVPTPVQQPRVSRFSCAVMSAPPDGYVLPSDSDTSKYDEVEEKHDMSFTYSVPEYEDEAYSTPQRSFRFKSHPTCILADTIQGHKRVRHTIVFFDTGQDNSSFFGQIAS